jgi:hypothetical protein
MSLGATDGQNYTSEIGPLILIRHPLWTEKNPRQDIPVMVFTINQWTNMQNDAFHIGAAPINPSELGRNDNYVFALPARYNFAYQTGFEEVDQLIRANNLKTFSVSDKNVENRIEAFNKANLNVGLFNVSGPTTASGTLFAGNTYTSSSCATNQNVNATYDIIFS